MIGTYTDMHAVERNFRKIATWVYIAIKLNTNQPAINTRIKI